MGDPTAAQRKMFANMGIAMPDGSYYVRNGADLQNAIDSVGRGENAGDNGDAIRKHIMARAAKLKLSSKIPATWNPDGSLKHDDIDPVAAFLAHFGVKGMHWGVNRPRGTASSNPVSPDAARAANTARTIQKHGVGAVSSADLQHLVSRTNLERQHGTLNPDHVSKGKKVIASLLKDTSQTAEKEASKLIAEYAVKGAAIVAREITRQALGTHAGAGKHA